MNAAPFIMYAECSVIYNGRAESTLGLGNYLIIYKKDGTLLIHNALLSKPVNYQPPGAELSMFNNKMIATRKNERIEITLSKIHSRQQLDDWSEETPIIRRTEQELKEKLIREASRHFNDIETIKEEYKTPIGSIDILIITKDGIHHVIEVKRKKANISALSQLLRYVDYLKECGIESRGYLAAPAVSKTMPDRMRKSRIGFIKADFTDLV